jgi:acetyl/propionyl-CoA carboxylase alpha subunit
MIEINGKKVEGFAQIIQGKLWVHRCGQTITTEASSKGGRQRRAVEGKSSKHLIHAPMPGKVTKIYVEPNQAVSVGHAIVVMEAMKMEYTLKCELDTTVEKVQVKVGDQVQLGQILVKLKELSE